MRIILVAYYYPPAPTVGSFRAQKVARAFQEAGHRVDVVTARLPDEPAGRRHEEPGLAVHAVDVWANPRHALVRLKRAVRGGRRAAPPPDVHEGGVPQEVVVGTPAWKRLINSFLWLPDDRQGFVPPAVRRARELAAGGADLLYTTAPPFSDHLAGLLLKRRLGIPWVAELRDPWTENPNKPPHVRSAIGDRANVWLERRVLRAADHVVAVSAATRDLLAGKLPPAERSKVLLALNGVDPAVPAGREPGPFRIVHTGSIYQDRDPRPFFHGLAKLVTERGVPRDDVRVEFVGDCRFWRGMSLEALARELGIGELVEFTDWVPQAEARRRVASADLLLLLFQNSPMQIANKLYDYLAVRHPILAFVDADGEVAGMLRQVGGHYVMTSDDPDAVADALGDAVARRGRTWDTDDRLLASWSTDAQMRGLLEALGVPRVERPAAATPTVR